MKHSVMDMVISCADDIGFERFENEFEIEERNRTNRAEFNAEQEKAAEDTRRTKLQGTYPRHGDVFLDDNSNAVAWFNGDKDEWVFDEGNVYVHRLLVEQQYYDRNNATAEWVAMPYDRDDWSDGWDS